MKRSVVWGAMVACAAVLLALGRPSFALADAAQEVPTSAQNGIPLLTIEVDESKNALAAMRDDDPDHVYGTIADINASPDHTVRGIGKIHFDVPAGFSNEYGSTTAPKGNIELEYLRGRGKSSWGFSDKRPYRIELDEPLDLFGMGRSSAWTLVANVVDDSLIRDRITYWMGSQLGLAYTPQLVPVDVVMVGSESGADYLGSYSLCESVRLAEGRIEVPELDPEDTDDTVITGGYLLSVYSDENRAEPESTYITTDSGLQLLCEYPEFASENLTEGERRQRTYITDYMNKLDQLIMESGTIGKSEHDEIFALMDARSTADYWWMQELSYNIDGYRTSSTYLYKDREDDATPGPAGDGKLFWGPLWDFDMAWPSVDDTGKLADYDGFNNTEFSWLDRLREKDRRFIKLLRQRWQDPTDGVDRKIQELVRDGGELDRYAEQIERSHIANLRRWSKPALQHASEEELRQMVRDSVGGIKKWIKARRAWVNQHLDELADVHYTMTYEVDGQPYQEIIARGCNYLAYPPVAPEREGMVFTGWKEAESGDDAVGYCPLTDTTFEATYLPKDEISLPEAAYFPLPEYSMLLSNYDGDTVPLLTMPKDASVEAARWTTSNADVAVVTAEGQPKLIGVGDTTITASFPNGVSASFLLHVSEMAFYHKELPENLSGDDEPTTIEVGDRVQLGDRLLPEKQYYERIEFSCASSDPSIAYVVDQNCRVVSGEQPGTATVKVSASCEGEKLFETTREVRVVEQGTMNKGRMIARLMRKLETAAGWIVGTAVACGLIYLVRWRRERHLHPKP